jgi:hypothetical protein
LVDWLRTDFYDWGCSWEWDSEPVSMRIVREWLLRVDELIRSVFDGKGME